MQVETGREKTACDDIKQAADDVLDECFVPQYLTGKRRPDGIWIPSKERLFPGYLICVTSQVDELADKLRRVRSLTKILGNDNAFILLTEDEQAWVQKVTQKDQRTVGESVGYMENGKLVIVEGPAKGQGRLGAQGESSQAPSISRNADGWPHRASPSRPANGKQNPGQTNGQEKVSSDKAKDYVRIAQSSKPAMVHPRPCVAFRAFKRIFDITSACLGLVLLSPLLLGTALAVKATSPGPVIFKQERYGRNKKPFVCFKFRSMMADTPADVPTRVMHENQSVMTPIGATLRKTSIDELPQLLNIVRGDIPLRILKTRPEFSEKSMGAFALPAKSSTNKEKAFSQVVSCFASDLRMRRISGFNCNCISGMETQFLAKPVFGAVCA